MRLQLLAVAREPKRDPLGEAADDYLKRARGLAPSLGFKGPDMRFIPPTKGSDPAREAEALRPAMPDRAILLDERGDMMTSDELSTLLAGWRDSGVRDCALCIGGADGFDPALRSEVKRKGGRLLAFGRTVWPHALCRTMLAEQTYRALAILANHPYHRGG